MTGTLEKVQVWIYHQAPGATEIEVLLLRTKPRGEHGEFWQPVTGGVEAGETPSEGAAREAREETGLLGTNRLRALGFEFTFTGRGRLVHETVYALGLESAVKPQIQIDPREHSRYEWVVPAEALARLPFESNRRALQLLLAQLAEAQP